MKNSIFFCLVISFFSLIGCSKKIIPANQTPPEWTPLTRTLVEKYKITPATLMGAQFSFGEDTTILEREIAPDQTSSASSDGKIILREGRSYERRYIVPHRLAICVGASKDRANFCVSERDNVFLSFGPAKDAEANYVVLKEQKGILYDGNYWELISGGNVININPEKIPGYVKKIFEPGRTIQSKRH